MNPDSIFQSMLGMDIGTMRAMTVIAGISTLVLYLYRIHSIIHCMGRDPGEFPSQVDRVVWCGLAAFMPLGIGAYLYDLVSRRNPFQLFFLIPFFGVTIPACYMFIKFLPHATNFNFNFLGI